MFKRDTFLLIIGLMFCVSTVSMAQQQEVSGRVIDSNSGEALPGVNISVKGTTMGTATDLDGDFTLTVPTPDETLVFSFIGYQTREIPLDGRTVVNIELTPVAILGTELVVVGFGERQQRDITGSVSTVRTRDLGSISNESPEQLLQGKVAGAYIVNNSGQPGGSTTVRIRGATSLNAGNSPLFIIDGVPVDMETGNSSSGVNQGSGINPLSSLNSDDIESISVLKDASAAAIYGARAANGVILVTTKRGRSGETNFNVSVSGGVQEVRKKLDVLNAEQFARVKNEAEINSGGSPFFTDQEIESFGEGTDWQDEIFRTGGFQKYGFSASGGSEITQFFVSTKYSKNEGIILGSDFKDMNLRLNLDSKITDFIDINNNFTVSRTFSNIVRTGTGSSGSGTGVVGSAIFMNPILPVFNPDGSFVDKNDSGRDFPNPVAQAEALTNENENLRIVNNLSLELEIMENFKFESTFGINVLRNEEVFFKPNTIFLFGTERNQAERGTLSSDYWINTNTFTYNTELGSEQLPQSLDLTGAITIQGENRRRNFAGAINFPGNQLGANRLSAGSEFLTPESFEDSFTLLSFLGRGNYSFDDKYIFTANARLDGSSRFGDDNKYGFFPSGAFAWRLSEENFIRKLNLFDDLKFRLSFGITGNQEIGSFRSLSRLSPTTTIIGEDLAIGFKPENLSQSDLKWEKTSQLDIGLDFSIWDGRMSVTADYYDKQTDDLLFDFPLPSASGFSSVLVNLGEVENKGIEFGININSIRIGDANLNLGFNIAHNNNEIKDLGGLESFIVGQELTRGTGNNILIQEGVPLGTFYGRIFDGIFQNEQEVANSAQPEAQPGDVRWKDLNGDGTINDEDRTILGDAQPDLTGGFSSNLFYKNFEFNMNINYVLGNDIFNVARTELDLANGFQNNSTAVLDRWTPDNPSNSIPRAQAARSIVFDDRFLESGSYLRFREITLAYNLPVDIISNLNLRKLRIFITGENLITITSYSGFDPEANTFGQDNFNQGFDFGVFPTAKVYRFGFDFGF